MHSADRRSRVPAQAHSIRFDGRGGTLHLAGAFGEPAAISELRQALEVAMYSEALRVTVDLNDVTGLPAPALRELEVARCLGSDMGQELHVTTGPDTRAAEVLATAEVPFRLAGREAG